MKKQHIRTGVNKPQIKCPGCSLVLPKTDMITTLRFHASQECMVKFAELSGFTLSLNDPDFIHQLAVDAYGAQHSGGETKNITTAFALIGLFLFFERGFTGRQVQLAHLRISKIRKDWPRFDPPSHQYPLTVMNILDARSDKTKIEILRKWAFSVWKQWTAFHDFIKEETDKLVP